MQWCWPFKGGHTNVHDEEWSGGPGVVTDNLLRKWPPKFLQIASQSQNFLKFLTLFTKWWQTNLVAANCVQYGYLRCWQTCTKTTHAAFLDRYKTEGDDFFLTLLLVAKCGSCMWISSLSNNPCNGSTSLHQNQKNSSKYNHHRKSWLLSFGIKGVFCLLFFLEQGWHYIRSVLWNAQKTQSGHTEQTAWHADVWDPPNAWKCAPTHCSSII